MGIETQSMEASLQPSEQHVSSLDGANRSTQIRHKRSTEDNISDGNIMRKGKACATCRKLKVKCDSAERGMTICSRCRRPGLHYLSKKKSWTSAEGEESNIQIVIVKLERALEDVLEKLNMPALDLYIQPAIVEPSHAPRPTRQNSEEPSNIEKDLSLGAMKSLIEATRFNALSSQLRSVKQRRKGGMRQMDSDLISEKIMSYEEGEEMLQIQGAAVPSPVFRYNSGRCHFGGNQDFFYGAFNSYHAHFRSSCSQAGKSISVMSWSIFGLVSSAILDRFYTLDDIFGLCIAAFWQPDLIWKPSGLCISMATELISITPSLTPVSTRI
ncbi:hypothetical protein M433DRAFT_192196 [Acidomyces richmondensis BFW]|nr:hypothetical protein M433DRAFT_192196 [Acidomyces richmondensis BFW]